MTITENTKFRQAKGIISQTLGEATYLYDPNRSLLFTLNESGMIIWKGIGKGMSISEITKKVQETYLVSFQKAEEDVMDIVHKMIRQKIIVTIEQT